MKNLIVILTALFSIMTQSQEQKQIPQVTVAGFGKVAVIPDNVIVKFGVENTGKDASIVKRLNDETVDKVLKFIKKFGIATSDFQTTNVTLARNYDYDGKKYSFVASQTVSILLKDISKYDALMMGLVDNGINNISSVEFKSTKIEEYKSQARKLAITDAKHKAEDFVSVLNQKIGKAILINDSSQDYFPQPMFKSNMATAMADSQSPKETLAVGEIEITANVSVSFMLE